MKRIWDALVGTTALSSPAIQSLAAAKLEAIQAVVANLGPITTFAKIGKEIGYSRQHVSKKMQERFKNDPEAMWHIGDDWRIPKATAALWIQEFLVP